MFIEPVIVRLRPRSDCTQRLLEFENNFDVPPSGITHLIDLDGNSGSYVWFNETRSSLKMNTTSFVETLRENPFDYILGDPEFSKLPVKFNGPYEISLKPYLFRSEVSGKVNSFAKKILKEVDFDTIAFLRTLCSQIHEMIDRVLRPTGEPHSPEDLLQTGKGACRDVTVFFMDACRSLGLPARFTSGYFYGDEEFSNRQLHAWAEVFLPGGGWRGYDPTIGLAVADHHVALASSPDPYLTAPTSGSYRGTGADSTLEFDITMEAVNSDFVFPGKLI